MTLGIQVTYHFVLPHTNRLVPQNIGRIDSLAMSPRCLLFRVLTVVCQYIQMYVRHVTECVGTHTYVPDAMWQASRVVLTAASMSARLFSLSLSLFLLLWSTSTSSSNIPTYTWHTYIACIIPLQWKYVASCAIY